MTVGCAWHTSLADIGVAAPCCVGRLGVGWFERHGVLVARYLHLQCWGGLDLLAHSGLVSLSFIHQQWGSAVWWCRTPLDSFGATASLGLHVSWLPRSSSRGGTFYPLYVVLVRFSLII